MDAVANLLGLQTVPAPPGAAPPNATMAAAMSPGAFAELLTQVGAALPGTVPAADTEAPAVARPAADTEATAAAVGDQVAALISPVPRMTAAAAMTYAESPTVGAQTPRGEAAEAAPKLPGLPIGAAPADAASASPNVATDDDLADVETAPELSPDLRPEIAVEVMAAVSSDLQPAVNPVPMPAVPVTTSAAAASEPGAPMRHDKPGSVTDRPRMGRPIPAEPPLVVAETAPTARPTGVGSAEPRPTGAAQPLPAATAKATAAKAEAATLEAPTPQPPTPHVSAVPPVRVAATPPLDTAPSPRRKASEGSTPADLSPPTPQAAAPARGAAQTTLPAAASPPCASPARQIAPVVVTVAIAGGTARLAVTLEPAELGRVEISVERRGETADVRIAAERPETLALLQRDQRELDRTLTQAGIGAEGRSLSFSLSDGGGFASGRDAEGRGQAPRTTRADTAEAVPAGVDAPPQRRLLSLLDLAV